MQNGERRKRRYAIDSETPEEFEQLAEMCQSQPSIYYDDKKIDQLKKLKKLQNCQQPKQYEKEMEKIKFQFQQFEGFDHNYESPNINYVDTNDIPPEIRLSSQQSLQEEIISYNVMIIGEITDQVRQSIVTYCKAENRKNSEEFSPEDLISPLRSKVCLDIAVKKISRGAHTNHVIKFLMYDLSLQQKYEKIVEIYIRQCDNFIIIQKIDQLMDSEVGIQMIHETITKFNQKQIKFFYFGYSELDFEQSPRQQQFTDQLQKALKFELIETQNLQQIHKSFNKITEQIILNKDISNFSI